ncbi:MAG TPA: hypothetical protein VM451_11115, partial [Candidatus Limnocylindria bacterium]|nr:hypothetical protein [Candidatus Limnocylindria bacterium]
LRVSSRKNPSQGPAGYLTALLAHRTFRAVTAEGALSQGAGTNPAAESVAEGDGGQMFCYRHPATETWLRCGRCDRPICNKCAIQGPVGSRCRECGKIANDPLTTFTPRQLLLGTGVALLGGAAGGFISAYIGYFSIIVGYFAGRFVADAVTRTIGFKRGPVMLAILFTGIIVGAIIGAGFQFLTLLGTIGQAGEPLLPIFLQAFLPQVLISAGAACFGAYKRLR